jgi:hypothetical protein
MVVPIFLTFVCVTVQTLSDLCCVHEVLKQASDEPEQHCISCLCDVPFSLQSLCTFVLTCSVFIVSPLVQHLTHVVCADMRSCSSLLKVGGHKVIHTQSYEIIYIAYKFLKAEAE